MSGQWLAAAAGSATGCDSWQAATVLHAAVQRMHMCRTSAPQPVRVVVQRRVALLHAYRVLTKRRFSRLVWHRDCTHPHSHCHGQLPVDVSGSGAEHIRRYFQIVAVSAGGGTLRVCQ